MKSRIILHSFKFLSFKPLVAGARAESHAGDGRVAAALASAGALVPALPALPPPPVSTWIVTGGGLQLPAASQTTSVRATAK